MSILDKFTRYGIWAQTIRKAFGFATGTSDSVLASVNWKNLITSTLAVLIVTLIAFRFFFPALWDVWAWSWVFGFSLLLFILAYLSFNIGRSMNGIIFLVIGLAMSAKYMIEKLPSQNDDGTEPQSQQESSVVIPDTAKKTFDTYLITTFSHNDNVELEMPPNTEVLQERSGFKQITRTDSVGFKTNEVISGDRFNAPSGRAKFTIKKGGPVTLKVWRD